MWFITLGLSIIGFLVLLGSFAVGSAAQQGAVVAVGVGLAVIPYCASRSIQEMNAIRKRKQQSKIQ